MQLLRPGLFFSFGAARYETRSSDLIELLGRRVDELDVASRRHVCPVYPRMFRKQREAAENPARFHAAAGGVTTCCRRRDFIFHSNVNRELVPGYFELRVRV